MEFEDPEEIRPWSMGPIAALVAAGYTAISTMGSTLILVMAGGAMALDGGLGQGDVVAVLGFAAVCVGIPALVDCCLAGGVGLLANRVRRSGDTSTLISVLLVGVVWSVIRLFMGFVTFSCLSLPANLLSLALFGGAAMTLSMDESLKKPHT